MENLFFAIFMFSYVFGLFIAFGVIAFIIEWILEYFFPGIITDKFDIED